MIRKASLILLFLASQVLLPSCTKKDSGTQKANSSFDRKGLLTNVSSNIILPAYTRFQALAISLDDSITAFNKNPDTVKLTAVQNAFMACYKQWQSTSQFDFGPANQSNFRININTYPADISQINANINTGTYDPSLLANLAAKGLPALDYLLFGIGADNKAILTQYTTDSKATNRRTYLATLSAEIRTLSTNVFNAWNNGYNTSFISADGTDMGSSIGQLTNQLLVDFEILKNYEIGVPSGAQSMGTKYPQKVQAYYSKLSLQLSLLHLQAIENVYLGKSTQGDGLGLDDNLTAINAKYSDGRPLNDVIKAQFATVNARLQALSNPLSDEITKDPAAVNAAYAELQKLTVLLKTDMMSSLGILINFGDNDGD
jgi:hypothetical protein